MPTLKPKHPNKYPDHFHEVIRAGVGEWTLDGGYKQQCLLTAKKFRCFLKSLREYPLHPLNNVLRLCDAKTRIEQTPDGDFCLIVHVKPKINFEAALQ